MAVQAKDISVFKRLAVARGQCKGNVSNTSLRMHDALESHESNKTFQKLPRINSKQFSGETNNRVVALETAAPQTSSDFKEKKYTVTCSTASADRQNPKPTSASQSTTSS